MKIIEKEIKELHIQEVFKSPLKTMIKNSALLGNKLKWCDGFLINIGGFNPFDELLKEQTEGIFRWQILEYTVLENYSAIHEDNELHMDVAVVNVSTSSFYREVVKYIRENDKA